MLDIKGLRFRAALLSAIRRFFTGKGFLEVDTPLRLPVIIPESNIVPLTSDGQYLQTSPELCMKRLLAAGCTEIFQICPCFRKDERGRHHLEEFTMLEWYRTGTDYRQLMADCEELFRYIVQNLIRNSSAAAEGALFSRIAADLEKPWQCLTVAEAFDRFSPMPLAGIIQEDRFEEILVEFIEPELGRQFPVFLCDYPHEMASLARVKVDDPGTAERFELYWQGIELANGFSELTEPNEQRSRFLHEISLIEQRGGVHAGLPEAFLCDLARMPVSAGIALGVDRLLMLLMGRERIADAVSFSQQDF
jgi:elongation factor P--(R)-beta-lysine ligase